MAKADTKNTETSAPAPITAGGFTISFGAAPAAVQRVGAKGNSPFVEAIKALPAPQGGQFASFFVATPAPDGITDADERVKASKEAQKKMGNSLTGATRREKKADATKNFAVRSVQEDGAYGVRVYRIEPEATETAPAA